VKKLLAPGLFRSVTRLHCTARLTQAGVPSTSSHPRKPATAQTVHNATTKLRNTPIPSLHSQSCQVIATRAHGPMCTTDTSHYSRRVYGLQHFQLDQLLAHSIIPVRCFNSHTHCTELQLSPFPVGVACPPQGAAPVEQSNFKTTDCATPNFVPMHTNGPENLPLWEAMHKGGSKTGLRPARLAGRTKRTSNLWQSSP
jgi:hypothetical protein